MSKNGGNHPDTFLAAGLSSKHITDAGIRRVRGRSLRRCSCAASIWEALN